MIAMSNEIEFRASLTGLVMGELGDLHLSYLLFSAQHIYLKLLSF